MRTMLLVVAALAGLAFAPAPFPRRRAPVDDLTLLQGKWQRVESHGQVERDGVVVTITGTRMQFPSREDAWTLTLDQNRRPRRIDFAQIGGMKTDFRGVYRIEGDTFTYCVRHGASEAERPLSLDGDQKNVWLQVYRRQKR
jgi:uncharacterized protein (TIGR03067 family)